MMDIGEDGIEELVYKKNRNHITRIGTKISLLDMEDSHLNNTIKLWLRKALELKNQAEKFEEQKSTSKFKRALRGQAEIDVEDSAEKINQLVSISSVYIAEALRRNLSLLEYQLTLQEIYK